MKLVTSNIPSKYMGASVSVCLSADTDIQIIGVEGEKIESFSFGVVTASLKSLFYNTKNSHLEHIDPP